MRQRNPEKADSAVCMGINDDRSGTDKTESEGADELGNRWFNFYGVEIDPTKSTMRLALVQPLWQREGNSTW